MLQHIVFVKFYFNLHLFNFIVLVSMSDFRFLPYQDICQIHVRYLRYMPFYLFKPFVMFLMCILIFYQLWQQSFLVQDKCSFLYLYLITTNGYFSPMDTAVFLMAGSEFDVNNMKAWIHSALYQWFRLLVAWLQQVPVPVSTPVSHLLISQD